MARTNTDWRSVTANILARADMLALLGQVGCSCKKNGLGHVGLCPWHGDKATPSLHVYPDGHAYCFGTCGRAYDAFDAWQLANGGTFVAARQALARQYGIDLPATSPEWAAEQEHHRKTTEVLSVLLGHARAFLAGPEGKAARDYLYARGLTDHTIETAHLGFWPDWQSSRKWAGEGRKFSTDQLREVGFRIQSQKDGHEFDLFAGCIVFPVFWHGQLVYMTGRSVPVDDQTQKRHAKLAGDAQSVPLYGLATIDRHAKTIIVCEGEIDTLTLQQAGLPAAGLMGASSKLEDAAAELLARKPDKIILMLDNDAAGEKATHRLAHLLGSRARVARPVYPSGCKDPNDYLKRCVGECKDSTKASDLLATFIQPFADAAPSYHKWMLDQIAAEPEHSVRGQRFQEEMLPYLATLPEIESIGIIRDIETLQGSWLKATTVNRLVRAMAREQSKEPAGPQPQVSASAQLTDRLVGEQGPFQALFIECGQASGTVVTLYSKRHGTPVPLNLANPRQVMAALAPVLGDVEAWVQTSQPIEPKNVPSMMVRTLSQMSSTMAPRWDLQDVAEGIHQLRATNGTSCVAMVDSAFRAIYEDGKWHKADTPIVDRRFLLVSRQRIHGWIPQGWTVEQLNAPLKYTPTQAFELVSEIVETGWRFRDMKNGADPFVVAMLPFALVWNQLWPAKPLIHFTAPSASGKSLLVQGLYAGQDNRLQENVYGGLIPTCYYNPDPSPAGIIGAFAGASRTMVLDEFERSEERSTNRRDDILRIMRTASTGSAARLRGNKDLGAQEDRLSIACLSASIEPIGNTDADRNRWYVIELLKFDPDTECDREGPEKTVPRYIDEHKIDMNELRRTIVLGLVDKADELRQAYIDVSRDPNSPSRGIIDDRWMANIWPCLAVAKVMGFDWREMAKAIVDAKKDDFVAIRQEGKGNRMFEAILHAPIEVAKENSGGRQQDQTTIATLLETHDKLDMPGLGVFLETGRDGTHQMWVHWQTASRGPLFRRTEFESTPVRTFRSLAKECTWCKGRIAKKWCKVGDSSTKAANRLSLFTWTDEGGA